MVRCGSVCILISPYIHLEPILMIVKDEKFEDCGKRYTSKKEGFCRLTVSDSTSKLSQQRYDHERHDAVEGGTNVFSSVLLGLIQPRPINRN